ncbi:cytochrome P450 [Mycolicibacterium moriokaense]|nr:cytochrome P450 [Mycolicibacterium moriokaense]
MRLPLDPRPGTSLPTEYVDLFRGHPTLDVELPNGTAAVAVARQRDVRTVLSDHRFSRAQFGMRTPGSDSPFGLVTVDPPLHTVRRRSIQRWLTTRRAQLERTPIEHVAHQLVDDLLGAGPPADIYARFCRPFTTLVHMNLLGLDVADLPYLAPRMAVAWSSGRYHDDEVAKAGVELREYLESQVIRSRHAGTSGGLIDGLAQEDSASRLTDSEIVTLSMGLLMAGAETTGSHLALGLIEVLERPCLADELRRNPGEIPSAVEELLRWVWFDGRAGAAGQAHVAIADVKLHDRLISRGEVVVPMLDIANRDPDVFPDADEFCPHRNPNPHLGFGHGRHRCIGMAFARVQLQVGLEVILSRLDGIALVPDTTIGWRRTIFTRGVWNLPATWRGGGQ